MESAIKKKRGTVKFLAFVTIGAALGVATEFFLFFDLLTPAILTQDYGFWLILFLTATLFAGGIKEAVLLNFVTINAMNIAYYVTRMVLKQTFYVPSLIKFVLLGTAGAVVIGVLFQLPGKWSVLSICFYVLVSIVCIKIYAIEKSGYTTALINNTKFNSDFYLLIAGGVVLISVIGVIKVYFRYCGGKKKHL